MRASLAAGCNLWNGGDFYGKPEHSPLTLLKKYYEKYPEDADKVVLNIKGGTLPDLSPSESVKQSVENSFAMLGLRGKIGMFESARRDPKVPLQETLSALAELVEEGKIGGVALSEVNAGTIREAAKIELSLFSTESSTNGIAKACHELDIPIVA